MAPVSVGPEGEIKWGGKEETSFKDADDFVFAFRLREIKVKKTGEVTHKPKLKGALFERADDEEVLRKREKEERDIIVEVEGLSDEDATGLDFRLDNLDAMDEDGQECVYVQSEE